jgi:hypothetical protein
VKPLAPLSLAGSRERAPCPGRRERGTFKQSYFNHLRDFPR